MSQRRVLSNRLWNVAVRRGSAPKGDQAKLAIAVLALVVAFGLIAWNFGWLPILSSKPAYAPPSEEAIQQLEQQEQEQQRMEDEGRVIPGGA
ncbi:MAG: hypothetical protein RBS39_05610 [Phycisphaerales bacterium]|jgi:hypothetical protein|nr:hypothetical protein [Phycisphaerales bacterium]